MLSKALFVFSVAIPLLPQPRRAFYFLRFLLRRIAANSSWSWSSVTKLPRFISALPLFIAAISALVGI
jgi:hypothetical protein